MRSFVKITQVFSRKYISKSFAYKDYVFPYKKVQNLDIFTNDYPGIFWSHYKSSHHAYNQWKKMKVRCGSKYGAVASSSFLSPDSF